MGLFGPRWRSRNPKTRAKALDRLDQGGLISIARDVAVEEGIRLEALDRLQEQQLLAFVGGCADESSRRIGHAALERLGTPDALAAVAFDQGVDWDLRYGALARIDDEEVLARIASDKSISGYARELAIERMHTGMLIAQTGVREGLGVAAMLRLEKLDDDEGYRWMLLHDGRLADFSVEKYAQRYEGDAAFLARLFREASSDCMRAAALMELERQGLASQQMIREGRDLAHRLMAQDASQKMILRLLACASPLGGLDSVERDYFYAQLTKNPCDYQVLEFLYSCDDPVGHAFMPLFDRLDRLGNSLTDEELTRILDVPGDFSLDYLKARMDCSDSPKFLAPRTLKQGCASVIYLMHERGYARERIERELPRSEHVVVDYLYQDSENDIRSHHDEFDVTYWA